MELTVLHLLSTYCVLNNLSTVTNDIRKVHHGFQQKRMRQKTDRFGEGTREQNQKGKSLQHVHINLFKTKAS